MSRDALKVGDSVEFFDGYYLGYQEAVYGTLFTGIAYGAYIVVYVASVYVLLSKPGFTSSPLRISLFGITTFMFALGVIALVLNTTIGFQNANVLNFTSCNTCYRVWETTTCLMCILCDAICAWRTVVLWNNNRPVVAILAFSILGTTATAVCVLVFDITQPGSPGPFWGLTYSLVFPWPILGTNMLSTGLIAWKVWKLRIQVRKHLHEGSGPVRVERVFALLLESGVVYSCIWILYVVSMSSRLPDPGFTLMMFVSGLYPTLIIILISKQMSPVDYYSNQSTGM